MCVRICLEMRSRQAVMLNCATFCWRCICLHIRFHDIRPALRIQPQPHLNQVRKRCNLLHRRLLRIPVHRQGGRRRMGRRRLRGQRHRHGDQAVRSRGRYVPSPSQLAGPHILPSNCNTIDATPPSIPGAGVGILLDHVSCRRSRLRSQGERCHLTLPSSNQALHWPPAHTHLRLREPL